MAAVAQDHGMDVRRLQEAVAVYKQYSKAGDSVMETSERIFSRKRAVEQSPSPETGEKAEPECKHCFHCPS